MATFKELSPQDIKTSKSTLNQLIDIVQEDISGSNSRRAYEVFVTGGVGPGVTSSLFQTVYDQNFSLQTANPLFDITIGLYESGSTVADASTGQDSTGKLLFPPNALMMREKVDLYKQFAQNLNGNSETPFYAPYGSTDTANRIDEALFVTFKRLISRDQIKPETFAIKMYQTASRENYAEPNLYETTTTGSAIFTDLGASTNRLFGFSGQVGNIVNSANTSETVGLIFYDQGSCILDISKIISGSQFVSGAISSVTTGSGIDFIGGSTGNLDAKFIPDLMVSASIDNIIEHFASTRFQSGSLTAIAFQNSTRINSTLVFARASADEFNYSSNPSYVDDDNRIVVIDQGQESNQQSFSFVTGIGLYDANDNLLAVGKLSRPVEKNPEKDITFRLRLDF